MTKQKRISVGNLLDFATKSGGLELSFTSVLRAQEGTSGHKVVQAKRPKNYQAEQTIAYQPPGSKIEVFGRMDGVYTGERVTIDEIKTTYRDLDTLSGYESHWQQAKIYAYMYTQLHNQSVINIQLTYYNLNTKLTKEIIKEYTNSELSVFFEEIFNKFRTWVVANATWTHKRNKSIEATDFPYAGYRGGQRTLAVDVWRAITQQKNLFALAATGIGKTIAVLFPALKALGLGHADRVFFMTAKTVGRVIAERTLADMRAAGMQVRSVSLTAKQKICFCPDCTCESDSCEYAYRYFEKMENVWEEVRAGQHYDRDALEELAHKYKVCPFELSLDISLISDVIIGDYNYCFDYRVYLKRFFDKSDEKYVVLVDEAHNLPSRAVSMYSASLYKGEVLALARVLKKQQPQITKKLKSINKLMLAKKKELLAQKLEMQVNNQLDKEFIKELRSFIYSAEKYLMQNKVADYRESLLEFYFLCLNYVGISELWADNYVSYFQLEKKNDLHAKLYCLDPSSLLAERIKNCVSTVFFSATLTPKDYYMNMLLGDTNHNYCQINSPFSQAHRLFMINKDISTYYQDRNETKESVAACIYAAYLGTGGNHLAFFPSYAYLRQVLDVISEQYPVQSILVQEREMSEEARADFLAKFAHEKKLLAFAVLGGVFGEGIDLKGEQLQGVSIVSVCLPLICPERELVKNYFAKKYGQGFDFAYRYPGMNKVMQAAGRLIRGVQDKGIILFIGKRFAQYSYHSLFTSYWQARIYTKSAAEIKNLTADFWQKF